MRWHFMREIEERGAEAVIDDAIAEALDGPDAIYLSLDIDVIDPGMAPGTGTPGARRDAHPRGPARRPPDRGRGRARGDGRRRGRRRRTTTRRRPRWPPTARSSRRSARWRRRSAAGATVRFEGARADRDGRVGTLAGDDRTPRPRRSPACTTSTCSTTRATSTCTSRSPARVGGPILELAAGTGRLAVPLAEAGYDVTGVDLDPAMLDAGAGGRATAPAPTVARRLRCVEADCAGCALPDAGSFRPRVHRPELAVPARRPRASRRRRSRPSPRTSRRAAWRSSTRGCPTRTTWPASTGG